MLRCVAATGLLLLAAVAIADVPAPPASAAQPIVGLREEHLDPRFWIARAADAQRAFLAPDAIARRNAELVRIDASVHDVEALPERLARADVARWLAPFATLPERELYDEQGRRVPPSRLRALRRAAALGRVPAQVPLRFGLVTRRADLRSWPTRLRVFHAPDDRDIDRFQESALFPGTPVAVLHESRDRRWWFVVSPRYAAWIERDAVALGARDEVFGYGRRMPYLVVTGATVETVHTPERPSLSRLQLDMGVRLPLRADWPALQPVNGQLPLAAHVVELPQHGADGRLELVPALLPRSADVASDYLPATPANLLRQGFKFLGERYGWGHSYATRDCSGFVSEVWRSLGVELPRNTRDQALSAAFERIALDESMARDERAALVATLQVGDLVYIPGHVMMVIGRDAGLTWVIHDTTGIGYLDGGRYTRVPLNSVAVTPLEPLMADAQTAYLDRIYSIQRLRAPPTPDPTPR
jgi:hypothetical protein